MIKKIIVPIFLALVVLGCKNNNDKNISSLPLYSYDNASRFTLVESWYRYTNKVWPKTYYKPLLEMIRNSITNSSPHNTFKWRNTTQIG